MAKRLFHPTLLLACGLFAAPGGSHVDAAPRGMGGGEDLAALSAMPELSLDELLQRTRVSASLPRLAAAAASPASWHGAQAHGEAAPRTAPRSPKSAPSLAKSTKVLNAQPLGQLLEAEAWTIGDALDGKAMAAPLKAQTLAGAAIGAPPPPPASAKGAGRDVPLVQVIIPADGPADEDTITARLVDEPAARAAAALHARLAERQPPASPHPSKTPTEALPLVLPDAVASLAQSPKPAAELTPASAPLRLVVAADGQGRLDLLPKSLNFAQTGVSAAVDLLLPEGSGLTLFVRDRALVAWDAANRRLTAKARGTTELYVVHSGSMHIVPLTVGAALAPRLEVPKALVSLEGVSFEQGAALAGGDGKSVGQAHAFLGQGPAATSLSASVGETLASVARDELERQRFAAGEETLAYGTLNLQLMDDRSVPAAGRIFPVADVEVRILGTEYAARTDATGHLSIGDVPRASRFLARLTDKAGLYRPQLVELASTGSREVQRLRVMRSFTFETQAKIAHVAPHAGLASLCGVISDAKGPSGNVAVGLDVGAEGPFYFNAYGFLDTSLHATGPDGRFCFYNAPGGPSALSVYEGETHLATVPIALHAGFHAEQDLNIAHEKTLAARLATMPNAHEQLNADARVASRLHAVDMVDLIPLGTDSAMMQLGPGLVESADPVTPINDRTWALSQAAEFESVLYTFDTHRRDHVAPLLPRGFVDDMALYAQVPWDPALGVVFVEFGELARAAGTAQAGASESVSVRLLDVEGRDVGEPWYFSDQPNTKALFFNVPSGVYAVQVETKDRYWLASDTTIVYNETTSYVRLGSQLRYRP